MAEDEMNGERDTDERLWHPWLRINRVLRAMLHEHWSAEAWPQVKAEFTKALALRSQIRARGMVQLSRDALRTWLDSRRGVGDAIPSNDGWS